MYGVRYSYIFTHSIRLFFLSHARSYNTDLGSGLTILAMYLKRGNQMMFISDKIPVNAINPPDASYFFFSVSHARNYCYYCTQRRVCQCVVIRPVLKCFAATAGEKKMVNKHHNTYSTVLLLQEFLHLHRTSAILFLFLLLLTYSSFLLFFAFNFIKRRIVHVCVSHNNKQYVRFG